MHKNCGCNVKSALFRDGDIVMICCHIYEAQGSPWRDVKARRYDSPATFTRDDKSTFQAAGQIVCAACFSKQETGEAPDTIETFWKNGSYWVADFVRAGLVTMPCA